MALTAKSARAADYALRVEASAECADEARLLEAIRMRSPGFTPAAWDTPGASRFLVRFVPRASDVVVELEATDANGARSLRSVPAQNCPEAVRASAWILTLLVDPAAAAASGDAELETPSTTEPTEPGAEPKPAEPIGPEPSPTSPTQSAVPARSSVPAGRNLDSPTEPEPEPEPPTSEPTLWQISIGGFGGVLQSALPETPLGFGAFVEAAWERESWFRPSARLAALDAGSGVGHTERGDVEVSFVGARLSLCPVRSSRAQWVSARLCALGELGRLSGKGHDTVDQGTAAPAWYAAGPALGVELQPWAFLAIELEGALVFPFNRDRFVFEPDPVQVGYEVPAISLSLALGVAWRF